MDNTTSATTATFATTVAAHRAQLEERHTKGYLRAYSDGHSYLLRDTASRMQRFANRTSLGGFSGLVAGIVAGLLCHLHLPSAGMVQDDATLLGVLLGFALWAGGAFLGHRYLAPVKQHLGMTSRGFYDVYAEALEEIVQAEQRQVPGSPDAAAAAHAMRPGLLELLDERDSIARTLRYRGTGVYRNEYHEALEQQLGQVDSVILDVCAEVSAAAATMLASRADLLVELEQRDTEVELRITRLTAATQDALADARQALADAMSDH